MTKDELSEIVDHVNASWGLNPYKDELNRQRKAWWHFLSDLESRKVMHTVDGMAVTGGFPPRPGDVRRITLLGPTLTAMEAWGELQKARESVYGGGVATPMSDMTRRVVERLGEQAKGMHTNGDRDKFIEAYNAVVAAIVVEQCRP